MSDSPRIVRCAWGRIEIEGRSAPCKDAKLYPGGSREWDWTETGTHHDPGILPADVEELIDRGSEVVVLSRGHHERLGVRPDTLRLLRDRGVEVHVLETSRAVLLYNELRETRRVAGLFHTTC
jgi:hypothetical protein